jgi:hypothetical protein
MKDEFMSHAHQPGDIISDDVLQELTDEIERGNRLFPTRVLLAAQNYANQHLQHLGDFTPATLWEYIIDRLQLTGHWLYANLEDYPDRFGYAITNADGRRLYIKLTYDNRSRVRVLSFHEGY